MDVRPYKAYKIHAVPDQLAGTGDWTIKSLTIMETRFVGGSFPRVIASKDGKKPLLTVSTLERKSLTVNSKTIPSPIFDARA